MNKQQSKKTLLNKNKNEIEDISIPNKNKE